MRFARQIHPLVYIVLCLSAAAGLMVTAVSFVPSNRAAMPRSAITTVTPAPTMAWPEVSQPPTSCLAPKPNHPYANTRFDGGKPGLGAAYKESRNAQGPSAVPANVSSLSAAARLEAVKAEFINRHCGGKKFGGDKKLFQVGFVGSDVKNLAAAPTHPHMNPNATISRPDWVVGLESYLVDIRWDKSRVVYEKLGKDTWTLAMEPRPGKDPWVKLVKHEQPKSWYLMLAVTQPDGSLVYERRRLECGFQQTYTTYGDVPTAFKLMQTS